MNMNNASSPVPQGPGYAAEGEPYVIDQRVLGIPPVAWQDVPTGYGQGQGFAQAQAYPSQSSRPSTQAQQISSYGQVQHQLAYPPQVPGTYGPQFEHPSQIDTYGLPQYSVAPSHVPASQHSFMAGTDTFPFSNVVGEGQTVSPQALQRRGTNSPGAHHREWNEGSTTGFTNQVDTSQAYPQISDEGKQMTYPLLNHPALSKISHQGDGAGPDGEVGKISVSKKGRPRYNFIIEPSNPKKTENNSSMGIRDHPFICCLMEPFVCVGTKGIGHKSTSRTHRNRPSSELKMRAPKKTPASRLGTGESKVEMLSPSKQTQTKNPGSRVGPDPAAKAAESTPPSGSESYTDDESGTESDSDEESTGTMRQETLNDVRGEVRPVDVAGQATWETIGILWHPSNHVVNLQDVSKATVKFEKLFATLREELKASNAELIAADDEKRFDEIGKLKELVDVRRKALYNALQAANTYGHKGILQNFSASEKIVLGITIVLRNCIKADDYNGELPKAAFQLMARFTTMREELLVRAKFEPIEKRFNRRGEDEIKNYITTIKSNAQAAEAKAKVAEDGQKVEKASVVNPTQDTTKLRKAEDSLKTSSVLGTKRPHEPDDAGSQSNKKHISEAASVSQAQKNAAALAKSRSPYFDNLKGKTQNSSTSAPKLESRTPPKTAPRSQARSTPQLAPKAAPKLQAPSTPQSVPKSAPAQSTLQSATKTAPKATPKQAKSTPESPPRLMLAEILESIERPRAAPKLPEVPAGPPETPEERVRRQRKESRRHLRVKFKEGDAIEEIRLFTHEQAEDEGRQEDMLRDAHDDRSEGMMHRQRVLTKNTLDDEDDYGEVDLRQYHPLNTYIFYSGFPEVRKKINYTTKGGEVKVESKQQEIQNKRESMELMVVYTDPKDIPFSPKEPSQHQSIGSSDFKFALRPPTKHRWLVDRLRQVDLYGPDNAMKIFLNKRFSENSAVQNVTNNNSQLALQHHANVPVTFQQMSQVTRPMTQIEIDSWARLEEIFKEAMKKPYPPEDAPSWMSERGKAMWMKGWKEDQARFERIEAEQAEMRAAEAEKPAAKENAAQEMQVGGVYVSAVTPESRQIQTSQPPTPHPQVPYAQTQYHTPQIQVPQVVQYPQTPAQYPQPQHGQMQSQPVSQHQQTMASAQPMDAQNIRDLVAVLITAYPHLGPAYMANLNNMTSNSNSSQGYAVNPNNSQSYGSNSNNSQGYAVSTNNNQNYANNSQSYAVTPNNGQSYAGNSNNGQSIAAQTNWNIGSSSTTHEGNRSSHNTSSQDNGQRRRDGGHGAGDRHRSSKNDDYKRGTRPCKFWQEGKCSKGESCTFRHD